MHVDHEQVVTDSSELVKLREGDIISVDVGAVVDGYFGDNARTFAVGEVSEQATRRCRRRGRHLMRGLRKRAPVTTCLTSGRRSKPLPRVRLLGGAPNMSGMG